MGMAAHRKHCWPLRNFDRLLFDIDNLLNSRKTPLQQADCSIVVWDETAVIVDQDRMGAVRI